MSEKCTICGEALVEGIDGVARCRNGHEKKKQIKHYTYPLGDEGTSYKKAPY